MNCVKHKMFGKTDISFKSEKKKLRTKNFCKYTDFSRSRTLDAILSGFRWIVTKRTKVTVEQSKTLLTHRLLLSPISWG